MNHHEPKKTCGRWEIEVQVSDNAKATRLIARDGQSSKTSFTHELKHFDQSNHSQVIWGCERSSWDLCGRSKRNSDKHGQTWINMDVPRRFHQQTQTDRFEKSNGYTYPHCCMSWFKMSSAFTVLASNLKPHSPNMFPTTRLARLNWGLEEWPRSAGCEKGY